MNHEIDIILQEILKTLVKLELKSYFTKNILISLLTITRWYSEALLENKVITNQELKIIASDIDNRVKNMPKDLFKTK